MPLSKARDKERKRELRGRALAAPASADTIEAGRAAFKRWQRYGKSDSLGHQAPLSWRVAQGWETKPPPFMGALDRKWLSFIAALNRKGYTIEGDQTDGYRVVPLGEALDDRMGLGG